MTAYNSTNNKAHAYIVDACSESRTYFRVHYVWDPDYVPTDYELAINPTWMYEQIIDGKDLVDEFYEDTLIQTSVSVGTNMCYAYFSQVTYPLYYIIEPYEYYDEGGLCYVPGNQTYYAMDWGGYDSLIKMFHSFTNLN